MRAFSFSGAGFMGIYHAGAAAALVRHAPSSFFDPQSATFLGASAGSLISTGLACGVHVDTFAEIATRHAQAVRKQSLGVLTPGFSLLDIARADLESMLPEDAHERVNGRVHISLTNTRTFRNQRISHFESRADLADACACSCYVPGVTGKTRPTFRGKTDHIDGGKCNLVCQGSTPDNDDVWHQV
jgi:predicted acylesterase/phospholipase RssA